MPRLSAIALDTSTLPALMRNEIELSRLSLAGLPASASDIQGEQVWVSGCPGASDCNCRATARSLIDVPRNQLLSYGHWPSEPVKALEMILNAYTASISGCRLPIMPQSHSTIAGGGQTEQNGGLRPRLDHLRGFVNDDLAACHHAPLDS